MAEDTLYVDFAKNAFPQAVNIFVDLIVYGAVNTQHSVQSWHDLL